MARILIAEDDYAILNLINQSLKHEGFYTVTASDGLEAANTMSLQAHIYRRQIKNELKVYGILLYFYLKCKGQ